MPHVLPDLSLGEDILQAGIDKGDTVLVRANSYWMAGEGGRRQGQGRDKVRGGGAIELTDLGRWGIGSIFYVSCSKSGVDKMGDEEDDTTKYKPSCSFDMVEDFLL